MAEEYGLSIKSTRNLMEESREDKLPEHIGPNKEGCGKVLSGEMND